MYWRESCLNDIQITSAVEQKMIPSAVRANSTRVGTRARGGRGSPPSPFVVGNRGVASLPFTRPSYGSGDHHVDVMAAAVGTHEPLLPIGHGRPGAISSSLFGRVVVRLDGGRRGTTRSGALWPRRRCRVSSVVPAWISRVAFPGAALALGRVHRMKLNRPVVVPVSAHGSASDQSCLSPRKRNSRC
jgi:hypothetical protein